MKSLIIGFIGSGLDDTSSTSHKGFWTRPFALVTMACLAIGMAMVYLGDWSPEFGRHPDEAAHFITGTLFHDWVLSDYPWPPVDYAREYYTRYPKVAIGHWPPAFYMIQAAWYSLFGVSRCSATSLSMIVGIVYLVFLFELLRRLSSRGAAFGAVALVVVSPVFRYVVSLFMADLLVALLVLGALSAYGVYLCGGRTIPALGFGVLSSLAILTKQDAITLAMVPPIAVVLLRRWNLLRDWRFYAPALVVVFLCTPYHLATHRYVGSAWEGLPHPPPLQKLGFVASGFRPAGLGCIPLLGLGCIAITRNWRTSGRVSAMAAVFVGHATGVAAVQLATPVSMDPRYLISLIGPFAFLAAMGLHLLVTARGWSSWRRGLLFACLAGLIAVGIPPGFSPRVTGYRDLVTPFAEEGRPTIVLVCSDSRGDGAIIAEFRLQNREELIFLIRADKVLASSTWMGQNYELSFDDEDSLVVFLESKGFDYVILDSFREAGARHHELLERAITGDPSRFLLVRTSPIVRRRGDLIQHGTARIYEVVANRGDQPRTIQFEIPNFPGGDLFEVRK
jgi:hypothetical protein